MKVKSANYILIYVCVLFLLLANLLSIALGQNSTLTIDDLKIPPEGVTQILTLQDGSTIIGRITEVGLTEIKFQADMGELTIHISKIKNIKDIPAESMVKGKYWFPNPNATRLYFAPTGRMLKKHEGYFSDIYVFFPGFSVGLSDKITFGGGMSIFPGIGLDNQVFYLTPKISLKASPRSNWALGALILKLPEVSNDEDNTPLIGAFYGVGTLGKPDASVTFGLGYGFVDDELSDKPMVMLGGEKRLGRRISFVSENWVIPGADQPIISYGLRFFGEGLSIDLALLSPLGEDFIFPGIPYIDFVFNF